MRELKEAPHGQESFVLSHSYLSDAGVSPSSTKYALEDFLEAFVLHAESLLLKVAKS